MLLILYLRGINMERAIDVVMDIHVKDEIQRLQGDIKQKCQQIAQLLGTTENEPIVWTNNLFYRKVNKKKIRIL
jgi:hypothetical protein